MPTLETLVRFAKRRIKRTDMDHLLLEHSIDIYREICQKVPFLGLQEKIDNIPLVADDPEVSLASYNIAGILSVRLIVSPTQFRRLQRSHSRSFDELGYTRPGTPALYARFGNKIELHPAPSNSNMTLRLRVWRNATIVDTPDELTTELVWPRAWDSLGKYELLYRAYLDLDEHEKAAWLMQPMVLPRQPTPMKLRSSEMGIIPRLWNDLLKIETERESVDEDFSINPLQRNYSAR
jgi:hypothetical protein